MEPPNEVSLAFHARLRFVAVGEAVDPRNGKRVRYLRAAASELCARAPGD